MTVKTIAALGGLALLITPLAMTAIAGADAHQPERVPVPTPVAELRASLAAAEMTTGSIAPAPRAIEVRSCGPAVRVVATGYGEPAGPRCTVKRSPAGS